MPESDINYSLESKSTSAVGVRTENFSQFFDSRLWDRRASERGRLSEQRRDALVGIKDAMGRDIQCIVTITRYNDGGFSTRLEPTNGAQSAAQAAGVDLGKINYSSAKTDIREALREVVQLLEVDGYSIASEAKQLLAD